MPSPYQNKVDKLEAEAHTESLKLKVYQRRYKANQKRAFVANNQRKAAERDADRARARHQLKLAKSKDAAALKHGHVAYKNHARALHFLQDIKDETKILRDLEIRQDKLAQHVKQWEDSHGAHVVGQKVVGGSDYERWVLACLTSVSACANGERRNFYSQSGSWDISHELHGGPSYGERSDCSAYVTGMALAAGLGDPNGSSWTGGFTGTLRSNANGWKTVSLQHMLSAGKPGFTVYGYDAGHHTEAWCPSDSDKYRTAGHGSAPVDFGTLFLFGSGEYQTFHIYTG